MDALTTELTAQREAQQTVDAELAHLQTAHATCATLRVELQATQTRMETESKELRATASEDRRKCEQFEGDLMRCVEELGRLKLEVSFLFTFISNLLTLLFHSIVYIDLFQFNLPHCINLTIIFCFLIQIYFYLIKFI